MQDAAKIGIALPLRLLIWKDGGRAWMRMTIRAASLTGTVSDRDLFTAADIHAIGTRALQQLSLGGGSDRKSACGFDPP